MTNGVEASRVTLRHEGTPESLPRADRRQRTGKDTLSLGSNGYVFTYRTYIEPKNTVGETSYGIIEHHWLLPGR